MTVPHPRIAPLELSLLGPFAVQVHGEPLPRLRWRRGEAILALLTLRHDRSVERTWLAGLLWPESAESQGLATLRRYLTDLRRALGPEADRLHSPTPASLALDLAGASVDVLAFDAAIARGDPSSLAEAAALYRGSLLEGWTQEWVFQERQAREQAYLQALESLAAQALERDEPARAERHLRQAVAADPLRESAQRALLQVLAAGGNYAAVLESYRSFREQLHRELNAEPDPETRRLFARLRREARLKAASAPVVKGQGSGVRRDRTTASSATGWSSIEPDPRPLTPDPSGTVTFLLTDLEGSTRLWEEYPAAMRRSLARHDELLHQAIAGAGGHVFKTMGDQFCAAFATAPAALAAALAVQRAVQAESWPETGPLRVRAALHTGTVEQRDGDYFGPAINRAAGLLEAGHGSQVLLTRTCYELVRGALPPEADLRALGMYRLKGLAEPEQVYQLLAPDLPRAFSPLRTREARRHNLPVQRTPLIGREREMAAVGELLQREEVGLVTLTGTGGSGKTRLALEAAAGLLNAFEHGVCFVELASIRDPDLVAATIAQRLGLREEAGRSLQERLKEYLRESQLLLVLDNFEHVLGAAPLVAELLAAAPGLKVLVTSRAPLHLQGEKEEAVPPLPVPAPGRLPPIERLARTPAVALFLQRVQDVKPEFGLTEENAGAVAELCRRLDGLPLALVLAAARIKLFSPTALLSRLEQRLPLLTSGRRDLPERQQTLRDTIAWSYDLLNESEQRLFRRLAVFVGGCTLESIEAVCNADRDLGIEALEAVAALVDQSLLQQEERGEREPRFLMLETIREFAESCLVESGEEEAAVRQRHALFFLALAEQEPAPFGSDWTAWVERLEAEYGNLMAALDWSEAQEDKTIALRLAGAMGPLWLGRGRPSEGSQHLARLLDRQDTQNVNAERAKALHLASMLAGASGEYGREQQLQGQCLAVWRQLGDKIGVARSLLHLAYAARNIGDYAQARGLLEEGLVAAQETEDQQIIAYVLVYGGSIVVEQGDYAAARAYLERGLALAQVLRNKVLAAAAHSSLGQVDRTEGNRPAARVHLRESIVLHEGSGFHRFIPNTLFRLAGLTAVQGQVERAARLFGAADGLREAMGVRLSFGEREEYERDVALVRSSLDEGVFTAAWAEGQAMTLEDAIADALERSDTFAGRGQ